MKNLFIIFSALFILNGCSASSVTSTDTTGNQTTTVDTTSVPALITQKCAYCHSTTPNSASGFGSAPNGIVFDTTAQMVSRAREINREVVMERTMPQSPITITEQERTLIGQWATQQTN